MKKICIYIYFSTISLCAQVGVGTTTPRATLDIQSSSGNTSTTSEGILVPRVSRLKALNMTNIETSTLIYVNDITTGTATGKAINITEHGHYYYDGSVWKKLLTKYDNIYTINGTINENRIVDIGGNSITFLGSGANGIIHERRSEGIGPPFFTFRKNNTNSTTSNGAVKLGDYLGVINFSGNTGKGYEGHLLTSNSNILAIAAEDFDTGKQGSHLTFNTVPIGSATHYLRMKISSEGNVGISTTDPTQRLDVNGRVRIRNTGDLPITSNARPLYVDGTGLVGTSSLEIATPKTFFAANPVGSSTNIVSNFNNNNVINIPISLNSIVLNTLGLELNNNVLTIQESGIYQISGSLNTLLSTGIAGDNIYMAVNIQKQTSGSQNWTSVAGNRPIFNMAITGSLYYNIQLPVSMETLNAGDKIRFVLYRTIGSNNTAQGSDLTMGSIGNNNDHGTRGFTLFISKM